MTGTLITNTSKANTGQRHSYHSGVGWRFCSSSCIYYKNEIKQMLEEIKEAGTSGQYRDIVNTGHKT